MERRKPHQFGYEDVLIWLIVLAMPVIMRLFDKFIPMTILAILTMLLVIPFFMMLALVPSDRFPYGLPGIVTDLVRRDGTDVSRRIDRLIRVSILTYILLVGPAVPIWLGRWSREDFDHLMWIGGLLIGAIIGYHWGFEEGSHPPPEDEDEEDVPDDFCQADHICRNVKQLAELKVKISEREASKDKTKTAMTFAEAVELVLSGFDVETANSVRISLRERGSIYGYGHPHLPDDRKTFTPVPREELLRFETQALTDQQAADSANLKSESPSSRQNNGQ